jgi:hypothetical protein
MDLAEEEVLLLRALTLAEKAEEVAGLLKLI